jgi:hypothetical protein
MRILSGRYARDRFLMFNSGDCEKKRNYRRGSACLLQILLLSLTLNKTASTQKRVLAVLFSVTGR